MTIKLYDIGKTNSIPMELSNTIPDKDKARFRWKELIYAHKFDKRDPNNPDVILKSYEVKPDHIRHWRDTGREMLKDGFNVTLQSEHRPGEEFTKGKFHAFDEKEVEHHGKKVPSLWALTEFPTEEAAKEADLKDVSITVPDKLIHSATKREYVSPIQYVALTSDPVVKGLNGFEVLALSNVEANAMSLSNVAKSLGLPETATEADIQTAIDKLKTPAPAKPATPAPEVKPLEFSNLPEGLRKSFVANAKSARTLRIDAAQGKGIINKIQADELRKDFASDAALELSCVTPDGFDTTMAILEKGSPAVKVPGQTMDLANTYGGDIPEESPLVKRAKERMANK